MQSRVLLRWWPKSCNFRHAKKVGDFRGAGCLHWATLSFVTTPEMKKTPSALKWLAEKRARVAGQLARQQHILERVREDAAELELALSKLGTMRAAAEAKRAQYCEELAALDKTVTIYDETLNPGNIAPIHAWKGRYGRRGALRGYLLSVLKDRAPDFVTTTELALLTMNEFSLTFGHSGLRYLWCKYSLRGSLKALVLQGLIERQDPLIGPGQGVGSWRWRQVKAPTLAVLRDAQSSS